MTEYRTLRVTPGDDRVVVALNRPEQLNAINAAMVTEIHELCSDLEARPRVLIISGVGADFAADADIAELRTRGRDEALVGINRSVFDRIATLPLPTIAAVEGNALGGGAELSYACDLRVASAGARFGNPEPGLGILAAAGASYRLADLVGKSIAKQLILGASIINAETALRCGLVAEVVADGTAPTAACAWADRITRQSPLALRLSKAVLDADAPHPLLDDFAQAVLFESQDKSERMTRFLERHLMTVKAIVPAVVSVIGGGRMGAGIAQVFATAGAAVTVAESNPDAAEAARERIATGLKRAAAKSGLAEGPSVILDRIFTVTAITELPGQSELVIEAVPEDHATKVQVLSIAEKVVEPNAVLASNTSSLSITDLAAALHHPRRFLGMHFFNPVPVSLPVEVVRATETANDVVRDALDWVHALGKSDVVMRGSPGFATSRLGVALGLEAIRMLEEGVADAESIDRAMELGYRHPMGPLRSTDLVGLDVRLAVAEHLQSTLAERFRPPQLLRDKVARQELGRKTGQGFYNWPS